MDHIVIIIIISSSGSSQVKLVSVVVRCDAVRSRSCLPGRQFVRDLTRLPAVVYGLHATLVSQ